MSMRYQAGVLTASYFPLKVPDAPTIGTASAASSTSLSVTFTAPSNVGGGAITGYIAIATDSSSGATFTGTGSSSPITVSGLTLGNNYTIKVAATNAYGTGPLSAASNSASPINPYSQSYTTAGSYSWIAPAGYTAMNVIVIGGGGSGGMGGGGTAGGGGGGYAKSVNVPVTPGNSYTVLVGAGGNEGSTWYIGTNGGTSQFNSTITATGGTGAGNNNYRVSGGVGSGGNSLNLTGGYGGAATEAGGNGPTGGGGGFNTSSVYFNGGTANQPYGGNGGNAVSSSAGQNGSNYGGGGAGGNGRYNTTPSSNCLGAVGGVFIYYP